jgi:vacuolar-type H+-ATPase subunit B/Vma2
MTGKKHPSRTKSMVAPIGPERLSEHERKKMELGDAMEHEHGQEREETERDIEELDKSHYDLP